ncbi:AaceriAFR496Wp [[Ashbya] aceris (nom. inval.)]|nr:AaceriAFR496Wp [[Ashbya] aceris (nom. inval.)]
MDGDDSIAESVGDADEVVLWRPEGVWIDRTGEEAMRPQSKVDMVGRRQLRKRTAVQERPYSVDRLRHREQMAWLGGGRGERGERGSSRGRRVEGQGREDPGPSRSEDEAAGRGSGSEDEGEGSGRSSGSRSSSAAGSAGREGSGAESSPEKIVFRGRVVDVRRGYRGVLPKVAWVRSLQREAAPRPRRRTPPRGRGVAVRKLGRAVRASADVESEVEESDGDLEPYVPPAPPVAAEAKRAAALRAYFDGKYGHSESSSEEGLSSESDELEVSSTSGESVVEDDKHVVDGMLTRVHRPGAVRRGRHAGRPAGRRRTGAKRVTKAIRKRTIRNGRVTTVHRPPAARGDAPAKPLAECNKGHQEASIKHAPRMHVVPDPDAVVLYERPALFVPVLEGLSDVYAMPNKTRQRHHSHVDEQYGDTDADSDMLWAQPVFEAVIQGVNFSPPKLVEIRISDRSYLVSMLAGDLKSSLDDVFRHIVDIGATPEEVVTISRQLSEFFCFLDRAEVYAVVREFLQNFRAKVGQLLDRAKPIHFYQIAVCQFWVLEISKYSSTTVATRIEMENGILDEIVVFFNLLSQSYMSLPKDDSHLLSQGYKVLSSIVLHLGRLPALWERLSSHSFDPQIAEILVEYFPTRTAAWSIAEAGTTFESAGKWFMFINHCTTSPRDWEVDETLLLRLYDYFKTRKFMDFEEELKEKQYPILCVRELKERKTLFNVFLQMLNSADLSPVTIERMTPLGNLMTLSSAALLANRLNLLLVLASKAKRSYEKRFEELLGPFFGHRNSHLLPSFLSIMLNGQYAMVRISLQKKVGLKGKSILLLWNLIKDQTTNRTLLEWELFLNNLNSLSMEEHELPIDMLKNMAPIMHNMLTTGSQFKLLHKLVRLYIKNLARLGPEWIQNHLFRLLATPARKDETLLDYYCLTIKHLAECNVITWWSVINYNMFEADDSIMLLYYTKICKYSDSIFFEEAKKFLYGKSMDFLLKGTNVKLQYLLISLSQRDPIFQLDSGGQAEISPLQTVKKVIRAFWKASYTDLIVQFTRKIRDAYLSFPSNREFYYHILNFLNNNYVDVVRNTHEFTYLKSEFSISDEETEKSAFREHLSSLPDDNSRCVFIEQELMQGLAHGTCLEGFITKLKSSMDVSVFDNAVKSFVDMIRCHPLQPPVHILHIHSVYVLLNILNEYLDIHCGLVTPDTFYELISLFLHMTHTKSISVREDNKPNFELLMEVEVLKFQRIMIALSQGFAEGRDLENAYIHFITGKSGGHLNFDTISSIDDILSGINHHLLNEVKRIIIFVESMPNIRIPLDLTNHGSRSNILAERNKLIESSLGIDGDFSPVQTH